ncbi:Uncharacterised protein [Escherichia coli]|uniref:Uncharacterized protein n=1 Tax=Escherichia coli TaxID=562 RepID=A0A447X3A3_ECOLX|nr:Uncharacterised protein [Escherichia coli]
MLTVVTLVEKVLQQMIPLQFCCCLQKSLTKAPEKILSTFKHWADDAIRSKGGIVSVADYWSHMNATCPAKINKKEADLMQAFAQKMGYCLAPDPYHHHVKADVDGVLVLFPAGERGRFSPSPDLSQLY